MTLVEFKETVKEAAYDGSFKGERLGQAVFNYVDDKYGVARAVQFIDKVDCFFDDDQIDAFLEASYKRISWA